MAISIVRSLPEDVWRHFIDSNPRGNIFHTPEMFQVFARAQGHEPHLWAAVDGSQPLALLTPVQITLLGGPLRWLTTRSIAYGSVLCVPGSTGTQALKLLLDTYGQEAKRLALFTELRNLSDLTELQPTFNGSGFLHEGHLNFLINLDQPEEALWKQISKSGRKSIRTSRKKGVIVEQVHQNDQVIAAYQLLQKVYKHAHVPLADLTLFESAFDILGPLGMFKIFLASINGRYIAARLILAYKDRIIAWYGGIDREFSSYTANETLVWYVLQWGQANGFRLFDFGGAGKPDEEYGPRVFKSKFGGTSVNYGRNTCTHTPVLKISKFAYAFLRRFL